MKIEIRQKDDHAIRISLPSGFVFGGFSTRIIAKRMSKYGLNLTGKQATALMKSLNRYRRAHPDQPLLECHEAEGNSIRIQL